MSIVSELKLYMYRDLFLICKDLMKIEIMSVVFIGPVGLYRPGPILPIQPVGRN